MFNQTFKKTFKCLAVWRQTFKKTFKCLAKRLKVFLKVWGVGGGPACSGPQESAEGKARGGAGGRSPPAIEHLLFCWVRLGRGLPPLDDQTFKSFFKHLAKHLKVFLKVWVNI